MTILTDPEVPVPSLSPSNEFARDGEGGLEGGLDDSEESESEEPEEASHNNSESNNKRIVSHTRGPRLFWGGGFTSDLHGVRLISGRGG